MWYIHTCVYIYVHIYTHTHIHTYMCVYEIWTLVIFTLPASPLPPKMPTPSTSTLSLLFFYYHYHHHHYYYYPDSVYRKKHLSLWVWLIYKMMITSSILFPAQQHQIVLLYRGRQRAWCRRSTFSSPTVSDGCLGWPPACLLEPTVLSLVCGYLCVMLAWIPSSVCPGTAQLGSTDIFQVSEELPSRLSQLLL